MAGRIAEELSFRNVTTGASNDFKVATNLAHDMVCKWGLSSLGPISYDTGDEVFLGREMARRQSYSGETASKIDNEIRNIILENYNKAKDYLVKNYDKLLTMSLVLMSKETIEKDIINRIHEGESAKMILGEDDPVFELLNSYNISNALLDA